MEHAAGEFGINPRTLTARIKQSGLVPGDDGKYSTKDISIAVFGDLERERIRLTSAEADAQEMKNRTLAGELVNVEEFRKDYAEVYVEMVRIIRGSGLSETEQDTLLKALSKIHQA